MTRIYEPQFLKENEAALVSKAQMLRYLDTTQQLNFQGFLGEIEKTDYKTPPGAYVIKNILTFSANQCKRIPACDLLVYWYNINFWSMSPLHGL